MKLTNEELSLRLTELDDDLRTQGLPLRYRPIKCFKIIHGSMSDDALRTSLLDPIAKWFGEKYENDEI
jgi:hypothetical protein